MVLQEGNFGLYEILSLHEGSMLWSYEVRVYNLFHAVDLSGDT
jgi:hypothetical protein